MADTQLEAFKKDLKALLIAHEASLEFMGDGDTHGIHDEGIGVSFKIPKKEGQRWSTWGVTKRLNHGWSIDSSDIE